MKLIGVNGGTFDPIHYGHLQPALEVQQQLRLQQVLFVPCYQPVHRNMPEVTAEWRCKMIQAAIAEQPLFALETFEIEQKGPSYMVQTLAALKQRMPQEGLVLMMGADAFAKFHTWHDWMGILTLANIAVMHRPGEPVPIKSESGGIYRAHYVEQFTELNGQIVEVAVTQLDISSTLIKTRLKQGKAVDYLLPSAVLKLIKQHQLY